MTNTNYNKTMYNHFERVIYLATCQFYSKRYKNHPKLDTKAMPYLIECMDDDNISFYDQNVLLDIYNESEKWVQLWFKHSNHDLFNNHVLIKFRENC